MRARRWPWYGGLAAFTAIGLVIRICTVLGRPGSVANGDPYTYHHGANLLATGHWFINPWLYNAPGHFVSQSASYPPLYMMLISISSLFGFKTFFAHRIWSGILGSLAIPLTAYVGRELVGSVSERDALGRRIGLVAAFFVAVYPNMWMNDELLMSETISPLIAGVVLLAAYRFWRRPRALSAAGLGVAIGLAAMARDEMAIMTLLVVPLALLARQVSLRWRIALVGIAAAGFIGIVGPWVGYNMTRFAKPVYISTGFGITLASANCPTTYSGVNAGYWSFHCALSTPGITAREDQSLISSTAQTHATKFIRAHLGELPRLTFDREGRAFGFFRPWQQVQLDSFIETRPMHWAEVGLAGYYLLVLLSIPGIVALRRRRVPVYPLLAIGLDVAVAVALTFGQTRYRSTFETSLVLMGAVGAEATVRAVVRRLRGGPDDSRSGGGSLARDDLSDAVDPGSEPTAEMAESGAH